MPVGKIKMKIIKITLITICVIFVAYVGLLLYADANRPKGTRYYLPEKYAGWVCVSFNVDGAPPLPIEEGFLAAKIPANGILKTSSEPRFSPTRDEYYYYNEKGIREAKELQHGGGGTVQKEGEKSITFQFWVSNGNLKSDYEKYVKDRANSDPKCGPWQQQKVLENK